MDGSIVGPITRNRHGESGSRKTMEGNGHWESRRWKIKSPRRGGEVLNQIWEEDFLGFSYGFRPGRSQHDALDALYVGITSKKVNYVLDLDIRSFFDKVDHNWR